LEAAHAAIASAVAPTTKAVTKAGKKQEPTLKGTVKAAKAAKAAKEATEDKVENLKMGELRNRSGGKRMRAAQERHDEVQRKRVKRVQNTQDPGGEGSTEKVDGRGEEGGPGKKKAKGVNAKDASTAHANIEAMAEAACARDMEESQQRSGGERKMSTALTTTTPGAGSMVRTSSFDYGSAAGDVPAGPSLQMVMVDGKMILNPKTLVVTSEREETEEYEEVYEKHGSNANLTSASYSNRGAAERWSIADTRRFYQCLRECGTNFQFIVQLMPGRTRRQVKAKFKKEERERPDLVDQALSSSLPMDLSHFNDSAAAAKQAQTFKTKAKALEAPKKKSASKSSSSKSPSTPLMIEDGGYTTGKANERPPDPASVTLVAVPVPADAQTYEV
jgi:hypothetical protein